jgi:hypothetical protein
MQPLQKKTPTEATDFEREQLRFFLGSGNVTEKLFGTESVVSLAPHARANESDQRREAISAVGRKELR